MISWAPEEKENIRINYLFFNLYQTFVCRHQKIKFPPDDTQGFTARTALFICKEAN